MSVGFHPDLLLEAVVVGAVALYIANRQVGLPLALGVVALKLSIPVLHFAFWPHEDILAAAGYRDPFGYLDSGILPVELGYNPLSLLLDPEALKMYWLAVVGGIHILYNWINVVAVYFFGPHMFAPVLINVGLTFVGALGLARLTRLAGLDRRYQNGIWLFFLLHYEVVVWSLLNLKDTLSLTMTIWLIVSLVTALEQRSWRALVAAGILSIGFVFVRFYIPPLVLAAFLAWAMFSSSASTIRKMSVAAVAILGVLLAVFALGLEDIGRLASMVDLGGAIRGSAQALVGYNPYFAYFDDDPFNFVISVLHWLMLPVFFWGAVLLWRENRIARFALVYAVALIVFLGVVPEAVTLVRVRFQVGFVFAWAQFHALWRLAQAATLASAVRHGTDGTVPYFPQR